MRSFRLLAVAALAVVLTLSSAQNAFALIELKYDDFTGGVYSNTPGTYDAVSFTLSDFGLTSATLLAARLWLSPSDTAPTPLRVHVFGADGKTPLVTPFNFTGPSDDYWDDAYIPGGGVIVTDGFWIALYFYEESPLLGLETGLPIGGHSYTGEPGSWSPTEYGRDYAIRALVQEGPRPQAVGGVVTPANTVALVSPWLAVIGLVGGIGTVVVVARKRSL
jgi:hypothetical protein